MKYRQYQLVLCIDMVTHQFDDLDQHPVVAGRGEQLEEDWSQ